MQILGILGKLDLKVILSLLVVLLSLGLVFFAMQNADLKESLGNAELELAIKADNQNKLIKSIESQNQALLALRVQKSEISTKEIEKIKVKDSTCSAELKAYKELFKELGK